MNFILKPEVRKRIGFSKTSIYCTLETAGKRCFTKQILVNAIFFLISKFFFTVLNLTLKQDVGVSMSIDPALFGVILLLYYF